MRVVRRAALSDFYFNSLAVRAGRTSLGRAARGPVDPAGSSRRPRSCSAPLLAFPTAGIFRIGGARRARRAGLVLGRPAGVARPTSGPILLLGDRDRRLLGDVPRQPRGRAGERRRARLGDRHPRRLGAWPPGSVAWSRWPLLLDPDARSDRSCGGCGPPAAARARAPGPLAALGVLLLIVVCEHGRLRGAADGLRGVRRRSSRRRYAARGGPPEPLSWRCAASARRTGIARDRLRTVPRPAARRARGPRDPADPGRARDDHDQPRRPVPRLPARRPDRAPRPRKASSPATRVSCPATTCSSTAGGRRSSTPRRSSSSRRASSSRTRTLLDDDGPCPGTRLSIRARPHGRRRRPRGLRHRQLRPAPGPPDDRDRDRVGLRRHLRRQGRASSSAAADQLPLVPLARASCARSMCTATSAASWSSTWTAPTAAPVRQRPARVRRAHPAQGRLAHLPPLAAADERRPAAHDARLPRAHRTRRWTARSRAVSRGSRS